MKLWLRFAALWISLALIGFAVAFYVLPDGLTWIPCVVIVLLAGILLMRRNDCAARIELISPTT